MSNTFDTEVERQRLETLGYSFHVEDFQSSGNTIYLVRILFKGKEVGKQSNYNIQKALQKALELAKEHKLHRTLRWKIWVIIRSILLSIALMLGVILFFGIWTLVVGNISLVNQISTSSWPTTEAEITSTEDVRDGQIEYRYVVDDEIYVSNRVVFFHVESICVSCDPKEELATRIAKDYPVGSTILIHYDPDNPKRAVLRHCLENQITVQNERSQPAF